MLYISETKRSESQLNAASAVAEKQGLSSDTLLGSDVSKIILMTQTKEQINTTGHVLKHFVETTKPYTDDALLLKKGHLLKEFMQLCRLNKWLEPAQAIWNDEHFMNQVGYIDKETGILAKNMATITLCYLDILYEKKMYQEAIQEVQMLENLLSQVPSFIYVLCMMACLRINTQESLDYATAFYNGKDKDRLMKLSQVVHPYALLLCRQGNPALAYEVVSVLSNRHKPILRTGVMAYILAKLDRPTEACALLEGVLRSSERDDKSLAISRGQGMPKIIFSLECVKALTKVVENRKDVSLNARLAGIFTRLDSVASITDRNMVDLITSEIDATNAVKNRRLRMTSMMEKKGASFIKDGDSTELDDDEDLQDDRKHR